jgi:hypothetical protein
MHWPCRTGARKALRKMLPKVQHKALHKTLPTLRRPSIICQCSGLWHRVLINLLRF